MMAGRTFGKKLAAGFGLTLGLTVIIAATSVAALAFVVNSQRPGDRAATDNVVGDAAPGDRPWSRGYRQLPGFLLTGDAVPDPDPYRRGPASGSKVDRGCASMTTDPRSADTLDTGHAPLESTHAAVLAPAIDLPQGDRSRPTCELHADRGAGPPGLQDGLPPWSRRIGQLVGKDLLTHAASRVGAGGAIAIVVLGTLVC